MTYPSEPTTIEKSHRVAWQYGKGKFSLSGDPPRPRGMLVGECPGPNTDARLPLFPDPPGSSAARLMRYARVTPAAWLGKLVRVNMCDGRWSKRRAVAGRARILEYLFDPANIVDGDPLRVLLLGVKVARAWGCHGQFGYNANMYSTVDGSPANLRVAWIPHPSGRNLAYNDQDNQLCAAHAVLWAMGERGMP